MAIFLGVDTGGTRADSVLIEDEGRVIASAKALTTKGDLAVGIGHAVDAVLGDAPQHIRIPATAADREAPYDAAMTVHKTEETGMTCRHPAWRIPSCRSEPLHSRSRQAGPRFLGSLLVPKPDY